jgi:hypothetical protein
MMLKALLILLCCCTGGWAAKRSQLVPPGYPTGNPNRDPAYIMAYKNFCRDWK